MSDTPRPSLKLTFGKKKASEEAPQTQPPPSATSDTSQRKLTLKIARKPQGEGAEEKPKKKRPSKKRPADGPALTEPTTVSIGASEKAGPKRLKLNPSKKPGVQSLRIKNKGLVPTRPTGVGYDSEASDTEIDPAIEEQFIIRMLPGDDCEYLRQAINERRFDRSEFSFKPLDRQGRRSILKIRDKQYAAILVDLPCIIEGMKSWDRRGWYKSSDICQMLLVLGPVSNDQEAMEYPLPSDIEMPDERSLQYPHGITPPLQWVRRRRFRERISTRTIEQVEKAVEDLLAQDEAAIGYTAYELVDKAELNRAEGLVQSGEYDDEEDYEYDDEQDADGEVDYGMEAAANAFAMDDDDLARQMERELAGEDEPPMENNGAAHSDAGVPQFYQAGTPIATKPSTPAPDTSGDESESDGDDGNEPEQELDEDQLEQQQQFQQQREEIAELEALIRRETERWEKIPNAILKNKLAKRIGDLKKDLALKKVSIGEGDDADN